MHIIMSSVGKERKRNMHWRGFAGESIKTNEMLSFHFTLQAQSYVEMCVRVCANGSRWKGKKEKQS